MQIRLWPIGLLLLWVAACRPQESVITSIEVTDGSTAEARQRVAAQIVQDLTPKLNSRLLRRVPSTTSDALKGLRLRPNVQNFHPIDGGSTTIVTIDCEFTHDGTVSDPVRIVDACRDEVRHALTDRVVSRPL